MKIPNGMTEDEVLATIERVVNRLYRKFLCGYYDADDIKQEARIIAMEGLNRYDGVRPLENFMSVHIKNRLCNVKRKVIRIDKPCLRCPYDAYDKKRDFCEKYDCKEKCVLYARWQARSDMRRNIISPIGMTMVVDNDERNLHNEVDFAGNIDNAELITLIDNQISLENRENWIKLRNEVKLSKSSLANLLAEIQDILVENGINVT